NSARALDRFGVLDLCNGLRGLSFGTTGRRGGMPRSEASVEAPIGGGDSESVTDSEVHVVVDLAVDVEVELEHAIAEEDVRAFAEAGFDGHGYVLDVVRVAERHDVRRVKGRQRYRRLTAASDVVAQAPAEGDRENVLVLDGHQGTVCPRPDLQRPVRPPIRLADVEEHVRDADQIAVLVQEDADARLVS